MTPRLAIVILLTAGAALCQTPQRAAGTYSADIRFDISRVPFSRYGSYIAFSRLRGSAGGTAGLYLRTVHGTSGRREVFLVELLRDGKPIEFRETASPTLLRLDAEGGFAEICLSEARVVRIHGQGVGIRFSAPSGTYGFAFQRGESQWEVNSPEQDLKYTLTAKEGRLAVDAPWKEVNATHIAAAFLPESPTGGFEGVIEEFEGSWHPRTYPKSFAECQADLKGEYQRWLAKMPTVPDEFQPGANLAAYVNWSAVVEPEGYLTRPAMMMSKNWMTNVWSWDHCFNAMALVETDPDLAWDQYLIMFDNQNADGALPDSINDRVRVWAFSKPPIHGWVARWMLEHSTTVSPTQVEKLYELLSRWTNWYFKFRDDDGDGVPQYDHGNDSGWDNSTVFRVGPPVESPDLSAYLVMQMDFLSDVERELGKTEESNEWKRRADELLEKMLRLTWKGDHFVAVHSGDHRTMESESLLLYLPILLGNRLPADVRAKLVAGLKRQGAFLTDNGLATESPRSPHFQRDGYWLGPIWAPSTMVIAEGLDAVGEKALAQDLRRRFCRMAQKSGMAENFEAISGAPLRDPAYTWTSSVYLIFAHELLR